MLSPGAPPAGSASSAHAQPRESGPQAVSPLRMPSPGPLPAGGAESLASRRCRESQLCSRRGRREGVRCGGTPEHPVQYLQTQGYRRHWAFHMPYSFTCSLRIKLGEMKGGHHLRAPPFTRVGGRGEGPDSRSPSGGVGEQGGGTGAFSQDSLSHLKFQDSCHLSGPHVSCCVYILPSPLSSPSHPTPGDWDFCFQFQIHQVVICFCSPTLSCPWADWPFGDLGGGGPTLPRSRVCSVRKDNVRGPRDGAGVPAKPREAPLQPRGWWTWVEPAGNLRKGKEPHRPSVLVRLGTPMSPSDPRFPSCN